jgi:hypothetical protein
MYFWQKMGKLGATVAGTDPRSTGGHPHNLKRKKETPMNKLRFTLTALAIMAFTLMIASGVQAQATRTWVSGVGDDVNPCSRTAPCKTFAGAISKTATNGEIDALDPGGFGAVTITKSITIDGSSTGSAGVLNAGGNGAIINITSGTDVKKAVTLRSISFQGAGTGVNGVRILAATGVFIENCFISGQNGSPGHGITDERTTGGFLEVDNTTITNNTGNGINVNPSSGGVAIKVHVTNSRSQGNTGSGLFLGSNARGTIFNSAFNQNGAAGIFTQQTAGGATEANVDHCTVSNNVTGFQANTASSVVRVSNSTSIGNGTLGVIAGGGVVSSYGNNQTGGLGFPSAPTGQQ